MQYPSPLAYFTWDPPREFFYIPGLGHPIMFYGVLFVLGFVIGYFITIQLLKQTLGKQQEESAYFLTDRLTWYIVLGTVIGARLGHVFFYDWDFYRNDPVEIFKIWKGGLASHGGVLGVIVGLLLFRKSIADRFPKLTLITLFDLLVIPSGLVGCCIRIGNFFNQEIVGPATDLPWAVLFAHPMEGVAPLPRHPTQLYEAFAYLGIFLFLGFLWKKHKGQLRPGYLSGLFFILLFSARFLIEFIKLPQSSIMDESFIQMGQLLSLPFIGFGLILFFFGKKFKSVSV